MPGYTCIASQTQTFSRGSVILKSKDASELPVVDMAMLADHRDVHNAIEGVKVARELFHHEVSSFCSEHSPKVKGTLP